MHLIEEKIISALIEDGFISNKMTKELYNIPFGTLTQDFLKNPYLDVYWKKYKLHTFGLRLAIDSYLQSKRTDSHLMDVRLLLSKNFPDSDSQNKAAGTYIMPIPAALIRQVYLQKDSALITLFQKFAPVPLAHVFANSEIPEPIKTKTDQNNASMLQFQSQLATIEPIAIRIQRQIRMQNRREEERNRIALIDLPKKSTLTAEEVMRDANTLYKPKCSQPLLAKIMTAVQAVPPFPSAHHITWNESIQNIFDEGLCGIRTLSDFYGPIDHETTRCKDIKNGDANVACLGMQNISPNVRGNIVIEFDLPKLIQNKPSAFYKQRDFGFELKKIRHVNIKNEPINFDHTGELRCPDPLKTHLKISNNHNSVKYFSELPRALFMAYDLEKMHEILTLNFFRFIDTLCDAETRAPNKTYAEDFYKQLNTLTDAELVTFLTDISKNMTDTAEFNFYGAHQIDFSTLNTITDRYKPYTIHLSPFIDALNSGNINQLREARANIPDIFNSYRFLDYLLQHTHHEEVRYYLDSLRKSCKTPAWISYTPVTVPETFEVQWDIPGEPKEAEDIHNHKDIEPIDDTPVDLDTTATQPVKNKLGLKARQRHFDAMLKELEFFSTYSCGTAHPESKTVVEVLKTTLETAATEFFATDPNDPNIKAAFDTFKLTCEQACQFAENHFKQDKDAWSPLKVILMGILGVITAIAATLLTLGIALVVTATNEHYSKRYLDTFFKPQPNTAPQALCEQWDNHATKFLFGTAEPEEPGLLDEIESLLTSQPTFA